MLSLKLGFKSTQGAQGIGFRRVPSQEEDDLRPYLEIILFSLVLGVDAENFEQVADSFGFDQKV